MPLYTPSLPEKEFRVMIVKMIQNLGNRMEKIQETFNKDLEELKSKGPEVGSSLIRWDKKKKKGEKSQQAGHGGERECRGERR